MRETYAPRRCMASGSALPRLQSLSAELAEVREDRERLRDALAASDASVLELKGKLQAAHDAAKAAEAKSAALQQASPPPAVSQPSPAPQAPVAREAPADVTAQYTAIVAAAESAGGAKPRPAIDKALKGPDAGKVRGVRDQA